MQAIGTCIRDYEVSFSAVTDYCVITGIAQIVECCRVDYTSYDYRPSSRLSGSHCWLIVHEPTPSNKRRIWKEIVISLAVALVTCLVYM